MNNLFGKSLLLVNSYLQQFALSNNFWSDFELAFGNKFDRAVAESIRQKLAKGNFSLPIRVLPDRVLGVAVGAFAAATNTVYLRESLVNSGDLSHISEVIIEEFGHSIDSQVNKEETPGDEGAIFRLLVKGIKLTTQMLAELRAEDDWAVIRVDGQQLAVEMAVFNGTSGDDTLGGAVVNGVLDNIGDDLFYPGTSNLIGFGNFGSGDLVNGGAGYDTLFVDVPISGGTTLNIRLDAVVGSGAVELYRPSGLMFSTLSQRIIKFNGIENLDINATSPYYQNLRISYKNSLSAVNIVANSNGQIPFNGITYQGNKPIAIAGSGNNDYFDLSKVVQGVTLSGNGGNDTIIGGAGNDRIYGDIKIVDVSSPVSRATEDNIVGVTFDDLLYGGAGNDTLFGYAGNDILNGVNPNNINPGINEVDNLNGETGSDRFILGDSANIYYDDQNITTTGNTDYALIIDFTPTEDKLQLQGTASNYLLQVVGTNTNLYLNKPGSEPDELIGVLQGVTGLNLTSSAFKYVASKPVRNDFNDDQRADILWHNTSTGQASIYQMDGSTVANEGSVRTLSLDWQIAGTGDFNGNSKSDILWRNQTTGETYIYQMDGSTTANEGSVRTLSLNWQIAGTGDFNGDNKSDILWRNQTTGETYIYQMDGSTVVNERSIRTVSLDWKISGTGDFNGDGNSDILWHNSNSGETSIYQMNGFNIASEKSIRTVDTNWVIKGVDDFNGDNKSDILWRNSVTGQAYIYQMDGLVITNEGSIGETDTTADHKQSYWSIAGTGDYNGDSKADILWRHTDGTAYVWNMDGLALLGEGAIRQVNNSWQIASPTI
jgi:RTX calcium-binding nonapeptide repeat (4 copies)/FG-GAP-like repeat